MSEAEAPFVTLAEAVDLPDAAAVQGAVTRAYSVAGFGFLGPGGVPSGFDPDGRRQRRAQELSRAMAILGESLPVDGEADELFSAEEARTLAKAYGQIARIALGRVIVDPPLPGSERRAAAARFVAALAAEWPALAGEPPTAWRDGMDSTQTGGRFYNFITQACNIYRFKPPSIDTVRRIIAESEINTSA